MEKEFFFCEVELLVLLDIPTHYIKQDFKT